MFTATISAAAIIAMVVLTGSIFRLIRANLELWSDEN